MSKEKSSQTDIQKDVEEIILKPLNLIQEIKVIPSNSVPTALQTYLLDFES